MVNVAPDEYGCLLESDSVGRFDRSAPRKLVRPNGKNEVASHLGKASEHEPEQQTAFALRQAEQGTAIEEITRKPGGAMRQRSIGGGRGSLA